MKMKNNYKVYASMISFDPEQAEFTELGPKLVIPLTYPGWFQLLRDNQTELHSLKTIAEVAHAQITEFMTHHPITGFRKRSGSAGGLETVSVPAGEVLTTRSVLTEWLSDESVDKSGCFCPPIGGRQREEASSYMKVRDSNGAQLLLSYDTEGVLFEVGRRTDVGGGAAIYRLIDVVRWLQLPVDLKLVRGRLPEVLADCAGLFRLQKLVVGCGVAARSFGRDEPEPEEVVEFVDDGEREDDGTARCRAWSTLPLIQRARASALPPSQTGSRDDLAVTWYERAALPAPDGAHFRPALARSLPPTPPLLLPENTKRKKTKAWSWSRARDWLKGRRKSPSGGRAERDPSDSSDYEVIPFCLRATAQSDHEPEASDRKPSDERTSHFRSPRRFRSSRDDGDLSSADVSSVPSPPPPPLPPHVNNMKKDIGGRMDRRCKEEEDKEDGSNHDEDGYLLPMDVRLSRREARSALDQSCSHRGDRFRYASSAGTVATQEDDASSPHLAVTLPTRTMTTSASSSSSSSSRDGPPNKSTMTSLPVPSSGAMTSDVTSRGQSEYASSANFDKQRLDAFLYDSIDELRRRQWRRPEASGADVPRTSGPRCGHVTRIGDGDGGQAIGSVNDVSAFLDRIFDCDSICDDDDKVGGTRSGYDVTTTAPAAPIGRGFPDRRSMSVPEAMVGHRDRLGVQNVSRMCLECGYQTIDSGIWLSPRSAISDPYRQERDSATYRSISDCSWVPPEDLDQLTVEEVGLSLRYIGMKESVVTRFCEEQIDGKQLAELTDQLIGEGFPQLNALERKKLRDFINGWRPKKWGYAPT